MLLLRRVNFPQMTRKRVKVTRSKLLLLIVFLFPGAVMAAVKGEVALGVLTTSGNSETQSVNGKFALDHDAKPWHQHFEATAINNSDDEGTTAERYAAGYKVDYDFTTNNYAFFSADYSKDLFGGVREKTTEAVGYGRRVLNNEQHKLDAEIGAGARQQEDQAGVRSNDLIGRFFANYRWQITETNKFAQTVKVEGGEDNVSTEAVSELSLSIIGNLFAKISFTVRNNSEVPAGTERTDTATAVNLSYTFGS